MQLANLTEDDKQKNMKFRFVRGSNNLRRQINFHLINFIDDTAFFTDWKSFRRRCINRALLRLSMEHFLTLLAMRPIKSPVTINYVSAFLLFSV